MALDVFLTILLGAITVVLTALAVMLAVLGIGIATLALWGYAGIKEELGTMARDRVKDAMDQKLKEYPSGAEILSLTHRLKTTAEFYELQTQLIQTVPNVVGEATPATVQSGGEAAVEVSPIQPYPGEEPSDVTSPELESASAEDTSRDSGPDTGAVS